MLLTGGGRGRCAEADLCFRAGQRAVVVEGEGGAEV